MPQTKAHPEVMLARITYIHHNCFILDLDGQTLVFDVPAHQHLPADSRAQLVTRLAGKECIFFFSHAHEDHFDPQLPALLTEIRAQDPGPARTKGLRFVLADDIQELYPESITELAGYTNKNPDDIVIIEPEQRYRHSDIKITALESNDQGVAFLIEYQDKNIFFAGDLALWLWPNQEGRSRQLTEKFYMEQLSKISSRPIHLAFANVDKRLPNLAGAEQCIATLRPQVFVPTHTFGHPEWTEELDLSTFQPPPMIFRYQSPGDSLECQL